MRHRVAVVALAVGLVCASCLSGFKYPLGSSAQSFIDKPLLGTWVCRSDDDPPSELAFVDFDGEQYLLQFDDHKTERSSHQVIGSRLDGAALLSVRPISPKAEDEWTILKYDFVDPNHLSLGVVDPQPFEDVLDDSSAVRDRLAERLDDPEVIHDFLSCTRRDSPTPQPQ